MFTRFGEMVRRARSWSGYGQAGSHNLLQGTRRGERVALSWRGQNARCADAP